MKELIDQYVGKDAHIVCGDLRVRVSISDVKISYGKTRYYVTPEAGTGGMWVENIELIEHSYETS